MQVKPVNGMKKGRVDSGKVIILSSYLLRLSGLGPCCFVGDGEATTDFGES